MRTPVVRLQLQPTGDATMVAQSPQALPKSMHASHGYNKQPLFVCLFFLNMLIGEVQTVSVLSGIPKEQQHLYQPQETARREQVIP